jgi:uncharacterized RDD family membrane protein YckC
LLRLWASGAAEGRVDIFELRWLSGMLLVLYFTLGEGLFGATPGKWLLGLRVSRPGQTGPPGLWRALVRTAVFHSLLMGVFILPEKLVLLLGPAAGGVLGGALFLFSAGALLAQLRRRWGYRGLHDLASGCHVTQKPLPHRRLRLPVKHPTPLSRLLPVAGDPLRDVVGGYAVRGRLSTDPDGAQVWVGEDRALARSVLIWLRPATSEATELPEAARPTRLRQLGDGSLTWAGTDYHWTAFAAPLGGPLVESINPARPLPWADARHLLEQLAEEFRAAEADGTLPDRIGLDQVWVEPNGRVQYLECSITGGPAAGTPLALLREVASLALEGRARTHAGSVRAPLPSHAIPVLNKLFTDGGYRTLGDFQRELAETHSQRPEVTPAIRAAQLGIQAAVLVGPLSAVFALTLLLAPYLVMMGSTRADQADAAIAALDDPEKRDRLGKDHPELVEPLRHPNLRNRLDGFRQRMREEAEYRRALLFAPQRFLLEQVERHAPEDVDRQNGFPVQVRELIRWAGARDGTPRAQSSGPWGSEWVPFVAVLLVIPVGLLVVAAALRGGVSMLLAGISVVRADGRPATRRQCALRAALVWLPVAGMLLAAAWLQLRVPERVYVAAALWLIALALLPVYVVAALKHPDRPPHDRITGTYLVPA